MKKRNYWYIQLHPSKGDQPKWYKEFGFESGIEAVRQFVENLGVVGVGLWRGGLDDIRRFISAQKGDLLFTWYSEGGKWYQALLEFSEDHTYYDPDKKGWDGEEEVLAGEFLKKFGLLDKVYPQKAPEKVWFPLFRKVKLLRSWDTKQIDYHPQGTFASINKESVQEALDAYKFRGEDRD